MAQVTATAALYVYINPSWTLLDEVQPASALQFPEEQPDPIEMQTQLEATHAQLRTANLLAIAGLAVGLIGLGVAVFGLIRRSKS